MKYYFVLFPLVSFFLSGCDFDNDKKENTITQSNPASFINEKAVWEGDLDKCFGDNTEDNCLINEIKKNGSIEAIKTVQYLKNNGEIGYVSKFSKEGPVGIAEVEYPFRANTNTESLLIPSKGQPIDIDRILSGDIDTEKTWMDFVKLHPDSTPWAPASLVKNVRTDDDGIKLIYSYPIKTCHACDTIASLYISYNFTTDGEYSDSNILEIK